MTTPPARAAGRGLLRLIVVVALYQLYAFARNTHGAASLDAYDTARRHADAVVALQSAVGLPAEVAVQALVLEAEWLVRVSGAFYGSAHFLVTLGVLALLAVRLPRHFDRRAGTLAVTTFVAVVVFAAYPVAPPRLMPPGQATMDTLAVVGGVWSYDHGVLERISDPFAALPSLHLAWATWCALVLWELGARSRRRRAWRAAAAGHLVATLLCVFVTGNHWYVDAVAGVALVAVVAAAQGGVRALRQPSPAGPTIGARCPWPPEHAAVGERATLDGPSVQARPGWRVRPARVAPELARPPSAPPARATAR